VAAGLVRLNSLGSDSNYCAVLKVVEACYVSLSEFDADTQHDRWQKTSHVASAIGVLQVNSR
jgi:hypothetical protein